MVSKEVTITNPMGMHMRPAQIFIKEITPFNCDVSIFFGDKNINAKSIMNLMAAGLKQGSVMVIQCDGPDEAAALQKAVELVESGLGE